MVHSPIIVAVDKSNLDDALRLADQLDPTLCRLKVGKELFTSCGPAAVLALQARGFEIFLDLKFHDIPNTTAMAVKAVADLGVWLTNVHANIGLSALQRCQDILTQGNYATKLIAVTVLTSMQNSDLQQLGIVRTVSEQALALAELAHTAQLFGVVCSAQEAPIFKPKFGADFHLITPGIRMPDDQTDDQARICTPKIAIKNGADFLVIGRPITQASNPNDKLQQILGSLHD